jgi:hypothetical protein
MDYARSASSESSDMAFPSDPSEFANDSRISYSQLDNTYLLETGNGQEFLWDTGLKRWIMQVCNHVKPRSLGCDQSNWRACPRASCANAICD